MAQHPCLYSSGLILSLLQVYCKWMFKVENETKHPLWSTLVPYVCLQKRSIKRYEGWADWTLCYGCICSHLTHPLMRERPYCLKCVDARDPPSPNTHMTLIPNGKAMLWGSATFNAQSSGLSWDLSLTFLWTGQWSLKSLWVYDDRYHSSQNSRRQEPHTLSLLSPGARLPST